MRQVGSGLALLVALAGLAGGGTWAPIGPVGGTVTVLASAPGQPDMVLAGTEWGVYLSEDRGESWQLVGLAGRAINALGVAPSDPDVVYAVDRSMGWDAGRVHCSTDGGRTWNERTPLPWLSAGTGSPVGLDIAVHPSDPRTLLVASAHALFRSRDGGVTWHALGCGHSSAVAIDPSSPSTYYAAFSPRSTPDSCDGVRVSRDAGLTWEAASEGLERARPNGRSGYAWIDRIFVVPGGGSLLLATTRGGSGTGQDRDGIVRSRDGGGHWETVLELPLTSSWYGGERAVLAMVPGDPMQLFLATFGSGVRRSRDGGASWDDVTGELSFGDVGPLEKPAHELHAAVVLPGTAPRVLVGSDREGVWVSDDLGGHWRPSNGGLTALQVNDLLVAPATLLAATSERAVQRTTDGGRSWATGEGMTSPRPPYRGGAPAPVPYCGGVSRLAAGPGGDVAALSCRGYRSTDRGATWKEDTSVDWGTLVLRLPGEPDALLAVPRWVRPELAFQDRPQRSRDGGATWEPCGVLPELPVYTISVHDAVVDAANGTWIHLATSWGVYTSTDGCQSWQPRNTGLRAPCGYEPRSSVLALAALPQPPFRLVAATSCGLFASLDGAASWVAATGGEVAGMSLVSNPRSPDVLCAATRGHGVLRSLDGGATWMSLGEGLPAVAVNRLLFVTDRTLLAATSGAGAWRLDVPSQVRRTVRRGGAPTPPAAAPRPGSRPAAGEDPLGP
ncbi:MAG: hypothetical protein AB2L07_22050 [Thermoanaerobaculaceae bacterium]